MHSHDDPFDRDPFGHDPFDHARADGSSLDADPFHHGWSSGRRHHRGPGGPVGIAISVVVGVIALVFFLSTASEMSSPGPSPAGFGDVGPSGDLYDDPCVVRPGESDDDALDRCVENFDPADLQPDGFGF